MINQNLKMMTMKVTFSDHSYPNWRRGLKLFLIGGGTIFIFTFATIIMISTLQEITPVSLSTALKPWWQINNWFISLFFALPFALLFGAQGAFKNQKHI